MSYPYTVLDVFAAAPLEGNALAVVHDADGLDEATMLRFARETRLSETTFVQTATESGADYRNRIFTMGGELPFAGHPSLGTAVAVARAAGANEARYVQQTGAGLQPVEVSGDGRRFRASMLQEPAEFGAEHDPEPFLAAVGLPATAAHPELPAQLVSTGIFHLLCPVRDDALLADVTPDWRALEPLLASAGVIMLYLFAADEAAGTAHARGLFVADGGDEDPATGSACGPLAAYLHARRGMERLTVTQGVEMGRPSRLDCAIEGDRVRVRGDVVAIVDGTLTL
jgi:trans-2,3-dihydro-3-hydroxyanthranilate isomerase